jgi:hypothetical protein
VEHAPCSGEMRNACRILVGKLEKKMTTYGPRNIWQDNIKTDIREIMCEDMN